MQSKGFETTFSPRFSETDGMGHIGNTVFPVWFEAARDPIFEIFNPSLKLKEWNLILAGFNVSFDAPTYYGKPVTIITTVSRIGGSSFDVHQRCIQEGVQTATCTTTMVYFDYKTAKSLSISDEIKHRIMARCFVERTN
ncbi:acyl-CoA thioesterase [Parashewanella spongiae]|uniref:Acyl-CoA thioesterase n=1 Tax=Parashewanella spongiae TaxID=342950 RepID=A0A3A6UC70_9GAMM|nr:thioesterase family protein [Parashewanella spongiae]MCL1078504.1 acyl-CoA thioesterase [Parashewanella spongiae]RJY14703.1 acyl-CoA thioesterase [Parashewanella spongiae]